MAEGPSVLVVNHWHDDNKGDGAITAETVSLIKRRYPGCRVTVESLVSAADSRFEGAGRHLRRSHPDVEVIGALLPAEARYREVAGGRRYATILWCVAVVAASLRALALPGSPLRREVRRHELVVLNGGSNIYDDPDDNIVGSCCRLLTVLLPARVALAAGVPVVGIGHSLGPFTRPGPRWLARRLLSERTRLQVRDEKSLQVAAALGVRATLGDDVAFGVKPVESQRVAALKRLCGVEGGGTLMVSIRRTYHGGERLDERLAREMAGAIRLLVEAGRIGRVVIVPHTTGPTPIEDDRPISATLWALLEDLAPVLITEDLAPAELCALYGGSRLTLAVRLHAAILTVAGGGDAFAISYFSSKTPGAMRTAGRPDAWVDVRDVRGADLASRLESLLTGERRRFDARPVEARLVGESMHWPALKGAA